MAFYDMPLEQLEKYNPQVPEPADWEAFWQKTLRETSDYPLKPVFEPVDYCLDNLETYDVSFAGYKGQTIKGWFLLPAKRSAKVPCIVEYIGYGGGRNFPFDWLTWSSAGYAHFVMDTRGQGSVWAKGDTPDEDGIGNTPQFPGFMTKGILDPETYYYRRLITDAVRAVQAAASHPAVDTNQIILTGGSQGGGLSLAVSGLVPNLKAVLPDVPYLCHFRRATEITNSHPYMEIACYCKTHRDKIETVFKTLSYFDNLHFAKRAKSPALFSVSLMDDICPPLYSLCGLQPLCG